MPAARRPRRRGAAPTRHRLDDQALCARLHRVIQEAGELLHVPRRLRGGRAAAGRGQGGGSDAGCSQTGALPAWLRLAQAERVGLELVRSAALSSLCATPWGVCLDPPHPPTHTHMNARVHPTHLGGGKLEVAVQRLERGGERLAARRERLAQQRAAVDGQAVKGVDADVDLRGRGQGLAGRWRSENRGWQHTGPHTRDRLLRWPQGCARPWPGALPSRRAALEAP